MRGRPDRRATGAGDAASPARAPRRRRERIAGLPRPPAGQRTGPRRRRFGLDTELDRAWTCATRRQPAAPRGGTRATSAPPVRAVGHARASASPMPASRGPHAVALRRARTPVGLRSRLGPLTRRARRWINARSACSSSRPSAHGSRRPPRSRRRAGWPRRSSRRATRSSSPAGSTRRTRRAPCSRNGPGVGIGAAHDIGPAIERAARGGRLEPAPVPRDRRHARRDRPPRDVARRRAPAAAARARPRAPRAARRCARRWPAASTRSASCSTRPRRGSAACGRPSASPTTGCAAGWIRSSARSSAAPSRSRSSPCATAATSCRSRPRREPRVKGIVHDASGSGQTLFIEPLVAVELGQRLARGPGRRGRGDRPHPRRAVGVRGGQRRRRCARRSARSPGSTCGRPRPRWPPRWTRIRAETADRSEVVLLSARHPGLTGRVVPIDIRLGDGYTALVVTGPNTGGKTVTLRTLGLLSLMHQAGLHVPAAPGSRLPIWRDVFADIGDEQSIAQSLSTFSGHLRSIIRIVEAAGPGHARPARRARRRAPTRPRARRWPRRCSTTSSGPGALVAATTHYAELKAYAHTTPGARNAAVEFDLETLSPTYRLTIGLPGGSQAFAIAERLGLPEPIVDDARSRLTESQRSFEATLASIRATEGETSDALDRARAAELRAAEALRVAAGGAPPRPARARRGRPRRPRRGGTDRRRPADRGRHDARRRSSARRVTAPALDEAVGPGRGRAWRACRPGRPAGPPEPVVEPRLAARASVRAADPAAGRAGSPPSSAAASGRRSRPAGCASPSTWTTWCPRSASDEPRTARRMAPAVRRRLERRRRCASSGRGSVASSLDLRGARVEEALEALDRYLDDAGLAGLDKVTDHPRAGHRRAARCGPRGGGQPSAGQVPAARAARRGRRRGDDRRVLTRPGVRVGLGCVDGRGVTADDAARRRVGSGMQVGVGDDGIGVGSANGSQ